MYFMTELNRIMNGNKLIADFMQVPYVFTSDTFGIYQAEDETGWIDWVDCGIKTLNYNNNWQLLMPVIEKIEKSGCIVEMWLSLGTGCRITKVNPVLHFSNESNELNVAVFNTIVDYIKHTKNGK